MKRLLMAAAAVALCASAAPAHADRVCSVSADLGTTCHYEPPQRTATTAARADVLPYWGVTQTEFHCLSQSMIADYQYYIYLNAGRPRGSKHPDPIAECNVPEERVAGAMDVLINFYDVPNVQGSTWIDRYCEVKAALPRNKRVCTYNDVTREYR